MSDPTWTLINTPEATVTLDASDCCSASAQTSSTSPIDDFYRYTQSLVVIGKPDFLKAHDSLARLLLLGCLSSVEHYLRSLLAGCIRVCTFCKAGVQNLQITLATLEYCGFDNIGLGFLENSSLADGGELRSQTKRLTGIDLKGDTSSLGVAIQEYEKVCHLRHAAIHSMGNLSSGNLRQLGLPTTKPLSLCLDFDGLHSCIFICTNFVRAYNSTLYRKMVERLLANRSLSGVWKTDSSTFKPVFDLFYSKADRGSQLNSYQAWISMKKQIEASLRKK